MEKSAKKKGYKKKIGSSKRKNIGSKRDKKESMDVGILRNDFINPSKIIFNVNNRISVQSPHQLQVQNIFESSRNQDGSKNIRTFFDVNRKKDLMKKVSLH